MIETWKDIPGYNGKYQCDREGNFRRVYKSGKTRPIIPYRKNGTRNKIVVHLTDDNGKTSQRLVIGIMAITFLGPAPPGCVPYHKNGALTENHINNIAYIKRKELGKITGQKSRRKPVAKINDSGNIVEVYPSARAAARDNFMSYQTVIDRCNGKVKSAFAPDGFAYAWEDDEKSIARIIRMIELENPSMPKASDVEFEW